jgi:hypothetical protein
MEPLSWQSEHSVETSASPERLWSVLSDVPGWKRWNAGIEAIEIEGPFAAGTWFEMTPPGQDPLRSQLIEVRENEGFVDETIVGEIRVRVAHRISNLGPGRAKVTYSTEIEGRGAEELGPFVSGDFPEVLAALVALAEAPSPAGR